MSLDMFLAIDLLQDQKGESAVDTVYVFDENITHNLSKMASECGLYDYMWGAEDNGFLNASQLIDPLRKGIHELIENKETYMKYSPENGWGSYHGLLSYAIALFTACKQYPQAKVRVSR